MAKKKDVMATRRELIKQVAKGAGFLTLGGLAWGGLIKESKSVSFVLRPPAALPEDEFVKACVKCGLCVDACPYDTLDLATVDSSTMVGTPYFKAREVPCYMCTDVPCVPPCPSGALLPSLLENDDKEMDINKAQMGLAAINKETCVAFHGIQCDACYRACPLLDEAIIIRTERNERTGKHAYLIPEVSADACTGCGICEHACITEIPAIKIFPREMIMGKEGDHYIKGWDSDDEQRLNNIKNVENYSDDNSSTLDYLNNGNDIFDDE